MLSNILGNFDMTMGEKILYLLISVIALLPALTVHEWAHGFAAYKLGDETAKTQGRLSLNPLDHLDPMGSLMMLLVGFGWAKPVPINSRYFKKPRRDIAIVSLAGPVSNFILGFVSVFLYTLVYAWVSHTYAISPDSGWNLTTIRVVLTVLQYSALLNIGLGTFNLIPLPPLDGSNVLICALPNHLAAKYAKLRYYTRYIMLALIISTWLPYPLSMISDIIFFPLGLIRSGLWGLFELISELILSPFFG